MNFLDNKNKKPALVNTNKVIPIFVFAAVLAGIVFWVCGLFYLGYLDSNRRAELYRKNDEFYEQLRENCNWKKLYRMMENQAGTGHAGQDSALAASQNPPSTGHLENSQDSLTKFAVQLDSRNVHPCDWNDSIAFNDQISTPKELENKGLLKFLPFYNDEPNPLGENLSFDGFALSDDYFSLALENIFTGKVRSYIPYGNSRTYPDRKFFILAIDNNFKIINKKEFNFPTSINGPFIFNISPSRWFYFTADLSTCSFIELEKKAESVIFVENNCQFENNKVVYKKI